MLEHHTAQQSAGAMVESPKCMERYRRPASARRPNGYQLGSIEAEVNLTSGAVLATGEFFEESKPEQRGVALKPADHCDYLTKAVTRNLLKIRGGLQS